MSERACSLHILCVSDSRYMVTIIYLLFLNHYKENIDKKICTKFQLRLIGIFFQFIINSYRDWIKIELWGLDVLRYNFV